jgi:hypothetical protein
VSLKLRQLIYSKFHQIINSTTHQILSVGGSSIPAEIPPEIYRDASRELKSAWSGEDPKIKKCILQCKQQTTKQGAKKYAELGVYMIEADGYIPLNLTHLLTQKQHTDMMWMIHVMMHQLTKETI